MEYTNDNIVSLMKKAYEYSKEARDIERSLDDLYSPAGRKLQTLEDVIGKITFNIENWFEENPINNISSRLSSDEIKFWEEYVNI